MANFYREQSFFILSAFLLLSLEGVAQINVGLQLTNPGCGGFSIGSITAVPNGGSPPYSYLWNTGSTNNPLNNIPAGTYSVTVTDFLGETGSATGTLTEPPPLYVQILVTECSLPGEMEAGIQGGVPPFNYQWSTGETTPSISNLQIDLYCLTVTDANSCGFQTCEFIASPMALEISTDTAFCGSGNGGEASVQVIGGVSPFKYEWSNGIKNDTIYNIGPGSYSVTITSGNECTIEGTAEIPLGPGEYDINFDNVNPGCSGSNTGSVTAIAEGGFSPYIYIWNTDDTAATVSNLPAGTYYVTATDDFGCTAEDSTTLVTTSSIDLSISGNSPTCNGDNDGTASVTASNGAPPYSYLWITGDTIPTIAGLKAGTYIVFVTDSLDCISIDSITLTDPPILTANASSTDVSQCGGNDGTGTVVAAGGGNNLPYTYLWNTGDTTQNVDSLFVGVYTVILTDSTGCSAQDSITINGPDTLVVSINGSTIVCHGESNGTLTANAIYGTPPYHYIWSNGDTTQTIDSLPAGNYFVTVTSSEGCSNEGIAKINLNPPLTINANVNHVSCFGLSNGSINVALGGGTSPLSILWNNGSNSTIRNNLSAGNYSFTITDANGCSKADTISVEQPMPLDLTFNSSTGSCGTNGFTIAIVTGGTAPYFYQWNTGATTAFIDNLAPGNYSVTINDARNCQKTGTVIIPTYPPIISNVSATNTTCNGTSDGTVSADPSGGIEPYTYQWSNGGTAQTLANLSPGTYSVTVTDDVGCTGTGSVEVELGGGLNVNIAGAGHVCSGQTGTLTANAAGGTATYSYIWSTGATTQTVANLLVGSYSVTVTDPNGCMGSASAILIPGGNFTINSTFENVKCFGENTGRIELNVVNAVQPINYTWSNGAIGPINNSIPAGNYSVTVTDGTGCSKTSNFTISQPQLLEVAVTGVDGNCGDLGSATSTVSGGTMPYFYQWSNGNTNPNLSMLMPGTYTLTVTDAKGCKATDSTVIDVFSPMTCSISLVQPISGINGNDGQLTAVTTNGTPPLSYIWSNGMTTQNISNLASGNYSVTMTDANDCVTICSFFLDDGARIGDFVWVDANSNGIQDTGEFGIEGVDIHLEGVDIYGSMVMASVSSNVQGMYFFDVIPGDYQLTFNTPIGLVPTQSLQGTDTNLDSDADPLTNNTATITLSAGENNQSIDAGFYVEINCDNITDAGQICCDQSLCASGDLPNPFTNLSSPSGGSGNLEYVWMHSDQAGPFNPNTWNTIANSDTDVLMPGVLQNTTYFIRRARRSGCSQFLGSNIIEVFVNDFQTPEISGTDTICINDPATFATTDYGANASYSWTFPGANPFTATTLSADNILWETAGDYPISISIDVDGCPLAATSIVHVTDHPDTCGYDLVLNGELTDTMSVLLDWLYPVSNTIIRTYLVEWAFENGSFSALGPPDSTSQIADMAHFFYTHQTPLIGTNSYRVILNDSEGNKLISNIVEIKKDPIPPPPDMKDYDFVHSYPNPFKDKITVDVYDRFDGYPITVEIFNPLGQLIYEGEIPIDNDRFEIETTHFPHGAYFLFVRYGGKPQKVFKLVK